MANRQRGANWSNDETWIVIRLYGEESVQTMLRGHAKEKENKTKP